MSLSGSEPLPNDINDLPPARQRHIRRQPRSASIAERQILLDSLLQLTAPTLNFFLLAFLGALTAGVAFYFDEPAILIVAIILFPFHRPVFGLALLPITHSFGHGLKNLVSLLFLSTLAFGAGAITGLIRQTPALERLNIYRFTALYWLDLTILGVSTLLCVLVLLRKGQLPRLSGVLLSYTMLIPLTLAGFGLTLNQPLFWPNALLTGLTHLGVATILTLFIFFILGFSPKDSLGWLLTLITLTLTIAFMAASLQLSRSPSITDSKILFSPTPTLTPAYTATPQVLPTDTPIMPTPTPTLTQTPSQVPTSTPTPTITITLEPTSYLAIIDTVIGAVIRETPDYSAPVIGYANDGDSIEILDETTTEDGSRWFQVRSSTGQIGWLLGSLVNTQTPSPGD